jgi:LacI family transcriptional regulator
VLNGRGGVKPETAELVIRALRTLDYPKRMAELHRGVLRIDVMLVHPESTFFDRLNRAVERIAATLDSAISVHRSFIDEAKPELTAARLADRSIRRSALIIATPEHPRIRDELFALRATGLPIVQIVSRVEGLDADYVGIENAAAGRMAGLLLKGLQPKNGRVIAFCHSELYEAHRQRISGFSDYLRRHPEAGYRFEEVLFHHDDAARARMLLTDLLNKHHDLIGLYNAGGTNSTLSDVLRRHQNGRDVCFVGHELTERSSSALREGTMAAVIDQVPEAQARRAIDTALYRLGLLEQSVDFRPIPFVTVTKENV